MTGRGRLRTPLLATLLVAAAAIAGGTRPTLVTLRLVSEPERKVSFWIHEFDEKGVRGKLLAHQRTKAIRWDEIVPEDRARLRRLLKLDLSEQEKAGRVDGVRLHLKGGGHLDGVLEKVDERGRHWLRRGGAVLPYPEDRIEEVEPMLLDEIDVYDVEDLHRRLVERHTPDTPEEHLLVAERMRKAGGFAEATSHYREAVRLDEDLRWRVKPELDSCEACAKDADLARAVQCAGKLARLDHRYAEARALLAGHGGSRFVQSALDEVDKLEADRLNREFHERKCLLLRRMLDGYLRRARPGLEEALAYVGTRFAADLRLALKRELQLSDEQVDAFGRRGGAGAAHWAGYGQGSFVFDPFAKRGKGGKSAIRGDPERWWRQYGDAATRNAFLRAYAAERLTDLFETTSIRYRPCEACGGTGSVGHTSVRELNALGGRRSWRETCRRCYGCGRDRVVAYR